MAPIGDDASRTLHDLVNKLESRVKELEDKLAHAAGGPAPSTSESVRMILMGPPGAGMYLWNSRACDCDRGLGDIEGHWLIVLSRQGNSGS